MNILVRCQWRIDTVEELLWGDRSCKNFGGEDDGLPSLTKVNVPITFKNSNPPETTGIQGRLAHFLNAPKHSSVAVVGTTLSA